MGPGIGDMMIVLPMLKSIKNSDPNAYIRIFTRSSKTRFSISKKLFDLQDFAQDFDYYSSKELLKTFIFLIKNGFKKYDYGFSLQYTNLKSTSIIPSLVIKIASRKTCGMNITNNPSIKFDTYVDFKNGASVRQYSLEQLNAVGIKSNIEISNLIDKSKLPLCPHFQRNDKTSIALCVGTAPVSMKIEGKLVTNNTKLWPYHYWVELAALLNSKGYNVFLMGGKAEKEEFLKRSLQIPEGVFDFIGNCDILQSLSLLNECSLVIGADTGLMHCAGALDKVSLTIFGCTDYREYLPLGKRSEYIASNEACSPCFGTSRSVLCKHHNCMKHITVEQVYNRSLSILEGHNN